MKMGRVSAYGKSFVGSDAGVCMSFQMLAACRFYPVVWVEQQETQGLSMMVLTVRPQEGPSRRAEKKPGWV